MSLRHMRVKNIAVRIKFAFAVNYFPDDMFNKYIAKITFSIARNVIMIGLLNE